jgi:hypothetical protein
MCRESPTRVACRGAGPGHRRLTARRGKPAARAALRSLVANIPVFQSGHQRAARLTMNLAALMRSPENVLFIGSRTSPE